MSDWLTKRTPLRLPPLDYEQLRDRVLARDNWRCQFCGSMRNLQVHHQQFRSQSGSDMEENLITLCNDCHRILHGDQSE